MDIIRVYRHNGSEIVTCGESPGLVASAHSLGFPYFGHSSHIVYAYVIMTEEREPRAYLQAKVAGIAFGFCFIKGRKLVYSLITELVDAAMSGRTEQEIQIGRAHV